MNIKDMKPKTFIHLVDKRTISEEYANQNCYFLVSSEKFVDNIPAVKIRLWPEHDPDSVHLSITMLPEEFSDFLASLKKTNGFQKVSEKEFKSLEDSKYEYTHIQVRGLDKKGPDTAEISIKGLTPLGYNVWKRYSDFQYRLEDLKSNKNTKNPQTEKVA